MIAFLIFVAIIGAAFLFSKLVDNAAAWAFVFLIGPLFFSSSIGGLYLISQIIAGDRSFSLDNIFTLFACAFFACITFSPTFCGFEWFGRLEKNNKSESGEGVVPEFPEKNKRWVSEIDKADMKGPSVYMKCPYCAVTLSFNECWIRKRESVTCENCGNNSKVVLVGDLGIKLRSPDAY